jgi:hypothetical protein
VRTIVGERLRPVYVLLEGDDEGEPATDAHTMTDEELVAMISDEFDAEVVAAEPDGEDLSEAKEA